MTENQVKVAGEWQKAKRKLPEKPGKWIGEMAGRALEEEALTTIKPGLVDAFSSGAHKDMDLEMFLRSAKVLEPYFVVMAHLGERYCASPRYLFRLIRQVGLEAEKVMYEATGGVNTHKGAIFTIGILSAAAGACAAETGFIDVDLWIEIELAMVRDILMKELGELLGRGFFNGWNGTHGEWNLVRYGSLGVRGEAAFGYPSVTELALPVLREGRSEGRDWNLVKLQALFTLMSQVEDGNVLSRTGRDGLREVQQTAADFFKRGGAYGPDVRRRLEQMDREFIRKNYSCGGCADLLAAAIFMNLLERGNVSEDSGEEL